MVSILHLQNYKFVRQYLNHRQKFWQGHILDFIFYDNLLKLNYIIAHKAFAL